MTDHATDDTTVSVTYAELATARGVSVAAARRLTLRHRWPKHPGNDGYTRVLVPVAFMEDSGTTVAPALDDASVAKIAAAATDAMTVALTDVLRVIPTLEAAVASLQGQLDTANERADQEKQRADRAESQVRELQEQLTAEMIEHRQMVALLLKRRSWWPWRR